jgi:hypothetical protein
MVSLPAGNHPAAMTAIMPILETIMRTPSTAAIAGVPVENEARNVFTSIIAALHGSRRLQARRILRQYAHLMVPSEQNFPHRSSEDSEEQELLATANRKSCL